MSRKRVATRAADAGGRPESSLRPPGFVDVDVRAPEDRQKDGFAKVLHGKSAWQLIR